MMQYIKLTDDKFIEYNSDTDKTRVIVKSEVEEQLAGMQAHLKELPEVTDKYLLEWARENYPRIEAVKERELTLKDISNLQTLLENLNG